MASNIISNDNSATPSSSGSNSYIKRLLKTYLQSAESSLSGPDRATRAAAAIKPTAGAGAASAVADVGSSPASTQPGSPSQPTPISSSPVKSVTKNLIAASPSCRVPVFLPADDSLDSQRKAETVVCGKMVACFDIGGEMRICVPDLLNKVLHDVTIDDINAACDKLCVHCSQCSDAQMAALISAGVLPAGTVSAGLMTKSQAERLCRYVFEHKYGAGPSGLAAHRLESSGAARGMSFMVYHECFGKCKGVFYADRYSQPTAACIECCQCSCLMSPEEFVCHGHHGQELRTCHWGFDASHWRSYLLVARDHCEDIAPLQARLEELKARFRNKEKAIRTNGQSDTAIPATPPPSSTLTSNLKRKDAVNEVAASVLKRARLDSTSSMTLGGAASVLKTLVAQHLPQPAPSHHATLAARHVASSSSSSNDRYKPRHHIPYTVGPLQYYKRLNDGENEEDSWRQAEAGDAEDRRTLVTMLQVATRSDSVPAVTRHQLIDNILAMFDQRSQIIAHLVQENRQLASKLQQSISAQARYKAALNDLEGAECLAALRSPHPPPAFASSSCASRLQPTTFIHPSPSI